MNDLLLKQIISKEFVIHPNIIDISNQLVGNWFTPITKAPIYKATTLQSLMKKNLYSSKPNVKINRFAPRFKLIICIGSSENLVKPETLTKVQKIILLLQQYISSNKEYLFTMFIKENTVTIVSEREQIYLTKTKILEWSHAQNVMFQFEIQDLLGNKINE